MQILIGFLKGQIQAEATLDPAEDSTYIITATKVPCIRRVDCAPTRSA